MKCTCVRKRLIRCVERCPKLEVRAEHDKDCVLIRDPDDQCCSVVQCPGQGRNQDSHGGQSKSRNQGQSQDQITDQIESRIIVQTQGQARSQDDQELERIAVLGTLLH